MVRTAAREHSNTVLAFISNRASGTGSDVLDFFKFQQLLPVSLVRRRMKLTRPGTGVDDPGIQRPRRTGRPRLQESVPRESILSTAARLFHEKGYQATTVRDIATAVGIQPGSLFHHFASKEQLLVEMLREASIALCVGADAAVAQESAPDRKLAALVRYELNCLVGDRTRYLFAVLISEWRDVPIAVRPEIKRLGQRYYAVWESVLEECAARGLLRLDVFATLKVLHGVDRGAMLWFRQQSRYTVSEFSMLLTNLVMTRSLQSGS